MSNCNRVVSDRVVFASLVRAAAVEDRRQRPSGEKEWYGAKALCGMLAKDTTGDSRHKRLCNRLYIN